MMSLEAAVRRRSMSSARACTFNILSSQGSDLLKRTSHMILFLVLKVKIQNEIFSTDVDEQEGCL